MDALTSLTGQQSVAPLTRQLRNESNPDVGLAGRDTSKERIAASQQAAQRISTDSDGDNDNSGAASASLVLSSSAASNDDSKSKPTGQRGSLIDLKV